MTTYISISRTSGSAVFSTDQSGTLTREQAQAVAERYDELFVAQMQTAYPDAEIDVEWGNGSDGVLGASVSQDAKHAVDDEIRAAATSMLEAGRAWGKDTSRW